MPAGPTQSKQEASGTPLPGPLGAFVQNDNKSLDEFTERSRFPRAWLPATGKSCLLHSWRKQQRPKPRIESRKISKVP